MRRTLVMLFLGVLLVTGGVFCGSRVIGFGGVGLVHAAETVDVGINVVQEQIILGSEDPRIIIAKIIRIALGFLGVIALLIVLWGGFQWMTSKGEDDKITEAKHTMVNGAIGLAIILSSLAITQFILNSLIAATGGANGPSGGANVTTIVPRSGSLGQGIIDMHYPPRGATDIARNTKIIITFKKTIKLSSLIIGYDDAGTPANLSDDTVTENLNVASLKIYRAVEGPDHALASNQVTVHFTPDRKTFIFAVTDPKGLGSDSENVLYTIDMPSDGLRIDDGTAQGTLAFVGDFSAGYVWQFETGTFYDFTPPIVTDYFPYPEEQAAPPADSPNYPRNVLIQVNFNEAIDPTSVVGNGNVVVLADGRAVTGVWNAAINNYRTAEFTPTVACGTNSCGETIYCLPANTSLDVHVRAADLGPELPQAEFPYNGIADVCGNSLNDHGSNATAEGSPTDDVGFSFGTSSAIDLTGPVIQSVSPHGTTELPAGNVTPDTPMTVTFNKIMSRGSINTSAMRLIPAPFHELWYSLSSQNLNSNGAPVSATETPVKTSATMSHGLLVRSPIGATPQQGYVPAVLSNVRDAFQNCFVPSSGPGVTDRSTCTPTNQQPYCCNGERTNQPVCGAPNQPGVNFSQ